LTSFLPFGHFQKKKGGKKKRAKTGTGAFFSLSQTFYYYEFRQMLWHVPDNFT
jgi:hypothetical protein